MPRLREVCGPTQCPTGSVLVASRHGSIKRGITCFGKPVLAERVERKLRGRPGLARSSSHPRNSRAPRPSACRSRIGKSQQAPPSRDEELPWGCRRLSARRPAACRFPALGFAVLLEVECPKVAGCRRIPGHVRRLLRILGQGKSGVTRRPRAPDDVPSARGSSSCDPAVPASQACQAGVPLPGLQPRFRAPQGTSGPRPRMPVREPGPQCRCPRGEYSFLQRDGALAPHVWRRDRRQQSPGRESMSMSPPPRGPDANDPDILVRDP